MATLGGTTGTYAFQPTGGQLILYAFGRCGIRATALSSEHMRDAAICANLIQADWATDQPNLWTVGLTSVSLVAGQAAYSIPSNVMLILDAYLEVNPGTSSAIDTYMYPISRTEYASLPNKEAEGIPSVYWFDRLLAPTVTLYQTPISSAYTFNYYYVRQIQDFALANGSQPEMPIPFLKAFADKLSAELAVMYAPERAKDLMMAAEMSYKRAKDLNSERTPIYFAPGLNGYYRS